MAAIVWKEIMDRASSANKLARRSATNLYAYRRESHLVDDPVGQQVAAIEWAFDLDCSYPLLGLDGLQGKNRLEFRLRLIEMR